MSFIVILSLEIIEIMSCVVLYLSNSTRVSNHLQIFYWQETNISSLLIHI